MKEYRSKGWMVALGGGGLMFANESWEDVALFANPVSGEIDTLHAGTWTPINQLELTVGAGRIWILENPVLIDRVNLYGLGGRRSIRESFDGIYQSVDTTFEASGTALNVGLALSAFNSITLSPDLFIELGLSATVRKDFLPEIVDVDFSHDGIPNPFVVPNYTAALEAIAGVGFMRWKGRYLRVHVAADLLQIMPGVTGSGKIPWVVGEYRPFRIMANWDIYPKRQPTSCAGPVHSEKSRELFGEEMRGRFRVRNNYKKRKKRRRDIY